MLDNLTSRVDFDLKPYKKYIDNEILVTLAQMDRPSKIFDYLYLVGDSLTLCLYVNTWITVLSQSLLNKLPEKRFHQEVVMRPQLPLLSV